MKEKLGNMGLYSKKKRKIKEIKENIIDKCSMCAKFMHNFKNNNIILRYICVINFQDGTKERNRFQEAESWIFKPIFSIEAQSCKVNKKLLEEYEDFKVWLERAVDYSKIPKQVAFKIQMNFVELEEYTIHRYIPTCNEILHEFYANLQSVLGDQYAYSTVKRREVPFTKEEILRAIPIPIVP